MKEIIETILGWTIIIIILKYVIKRIKQKKEEINNYSIFINNSNNNTNNIENKQIKDNQKTYNEYYYKREKLLTNTELKFYKILKEIVKKYNYNVFTQVVLYEIVRNKEIMDFNKIKSKSIDFVITDDNSKILICIELDDNTHNNKRRIERDIFINNLFRDLNIKLLRIKTREQYNTIELEKKIINKINMQTNIKKN